MNTEIIVGAMFFSCTILGVIGATFAEARGRSPLGWFILCSGLGILGLVFLALTSRNPKHSKSPIIQEIIIAIVSAFAIFCSFMLLIYA